MTFPLNNLNKYQVILASQSPRRKELLSNMGLQFQVKIIPDIDESYPDDMDPMIVAEFLANKKGQAYRKLIQGNELIITADTVVIIDGIILGKPNARDDAFSMIKQLSGKTHQVVTGVSIETKDHHVSFSASTNVNFDRLNDDEIYYYVDYFKPFDKAGAYGIQEWIGHVGISSIEGSYFNVMGLPVQKLYQTLKTIS